MFLFVIMTITLASHMKYSTLTFNFVGLMQDVILYVDSQSVGLASIGPLE